MDLYSDQGRSMPQRWTITIVQSIILAVAGWLLFGGIRSINDLFGWHFTQGNHLRNLTFFVLFLIVYIRICFTVFYLLKRSLPWAEAMNIPIAFGLYYIGFSLFDLNSSSPMTIADILFILLFLLGSGMNTFSEWRRDQWKKDPKNKGKLYTGGLFKYSMHVNYFGDVLWVTALALLTHNLWSMLIPIMLLGLFVFYNIPLLDRHLEKKYGEDFRTYKKSAKKLIPFIY